MKPAVLSRSSIDSTRYVRFRKQCAILNQDTPAEKLSSPWTLRDLQQAVLVSTPEPTLGPRVHVTPPTNGLGCDQRRADGDGSSSQSCMEGVQFVNGMTHAHTEIAHGASSQFSTDPAGLPEATTPQSVELRNGLRRTSAAVEAQCLPQRRLCVPRHSYITARLRPRTSPATSPVLTRPNGGCRGTCGSV